MRDTAFGQRLVFGLVTASLVIGLTTQDCAENAVAELGMDGLRFRAPVFHGDTLYAYSEVIGKRDSAERPRRRGRGLPPLGASRPAVRPCLKASAGC